MEARVRRARGGQAAVEYLLTTMILATIFAAMYGYLQGAVRKLYTSAAIKILTSYPRGGGS